MPWTARAYAMDFVGEENAAVRQTGFSSVQLFQGPEGRSKLPICFPIAIFGKRSNLKLRLSL